MYYSGENQCVRYVELSDIQACDNETENDLLWHRSFMHTKGLEVSVLSYFAIYWDLDRIISLFLFGPQSPLNDELFRPS